MWLLQIKDDFFVSLKADSEENYDPLSQLVNLSPFYKVQQRRYTNKISKKLHLKQLSTTILMFCDVHKFLRKSLLQGVQKSRNQDRYHRPDEDYQRVKIIESRLGPVCSQAFAEISTETSNFFNVNLFEVRVPCDKYLRKVTTKKTRNYNFTVWKLIWKNSPQGI